MVMVDFRPFIFLLTVAILNVASAHSRQYQFFSTEMNWTEAQSFCRRINTDLATVTNQEELSSLIGATTKQFNYTGQAWIGLHDDLVASWRWSLNDPSSYGGGGTEFRNWDSAQPDNVGGQQYCVELNGQRMGRWEDLQCNFRQPFVCYKGLEQGNPPFVKVQIPLNWTEAQTFCRINYIDLASIRTATENAEVTSLTPETSVWIGLHRAKVWADGSTSVFRNWTSRRPDGVGAQCVTTALNDSGRWMDFDCSSSFPFICFYEGPPNAVGFISTGQNLTSISLQWNLVNSSVSFVLLFEGREIKIGAPGGAGPVTHTVSSLTPGAQYTFTLFSVFGGVRSSGVNVTTATAHVVGLNIKLRSVIELSESDINNQASELIRQHGAALGVMAVKIRKVTRLRED